jgi:hypothetical protein
MVSKHAVNRTDIELEASLTAYLLYPIYLSRHSIVVHPFLECSQLVL